MHLGRKILNLRCDRKISQQDLARACDITPSALSKIEAGINSPRATIIWRLAQNLGVTVEFLLDETIPYPYSAYTYRQKLLAENENPEREIEKSVTLEEAAFLDALRATHPVTREVAYSLPEVSVETLRLVHFLVHHSRIENPDPEFWRSFRALITGEPEGAAVEEADAPDADEGGDRRATKYRPRRERAGEEEPKKSGRTANGQKSPARTGRRKAESSAPRNSRR